MSYSLQQCVQLCKKEYPDMAPYKYLMLNDKYLFNLAPKGRNPESSIAEYHLVDPETGMISGALPTMELIKDKKFREAWLNNAKPVDEVAEHSCFFQKPTVSSAGNGWAVRSTRVIQNGELYHHGIPNQRWGVRNGPPYPLDAQTRKEVVNRTDQKEGLIPELTLLGASLIYYIDAKINGPIRKTIKRIKQNRWTKQSEELNDALIGDIAEHKDFTEDDPPKIIVGEHSIDEDMRAVNPNYRGTVVPGTTQNCTLCSYTYDMRRRGYDVTAKPSVTGNFTDTLMADLYKGGHVDVIRKNDWNLVYSEAAKKYPEGSRGVVSVYSPFGGHAMAWEIQDGKLVIIDAQRNVKSSVDEMQIFGFNPRLSEFIRTDNLEVRTENIGKVCSELKPNWEKTSKSKNMERAKEASEVKKKTMTRKEKREALEKIWMKDHEGHTHMDAEARKSMENWIDANMWSMYGHEGIVLIHKNGGGMAMSNNAIWGVRPTGASDSLIHYGIKGQQWGIRRFQNEDGSLTEEGKERYYNTDSRHKDEKKEHQTGTNKEGEPVRIRPKGGNKESENWKADEAKDLTDEELNRRTNRLQREKQYQDLLNPNKNNGGNKGSWLKDVVKEAAKAIFVTAAVTPLAVVMGKKYKALFGKARDWLHKIAGKPLPKKTEPSYFEGKKK